MTHKVWFILFTALLVIACPFSAAEQEYLLIIDCSGSMSKGVDGQPRIQVAKKAALELIKNVPDGTKLGLRAYGHRYSTQDQIRSCKDTELLSPITYVNQNSREFMSKKVLGLECNGFTPIAYTLQQSQADFTRGSKQRVIILLSDGEETCSGNPVAVARSFYSGSIKVVTNVIGFAVDQQTKVQLESIASAGGGSYYSAKDESSLTQSLQKAVKNEPAGIVYQQMYMKDAWSKVKAFINEKWGQGYYITSLIYDGTHYIVFMTHGIYSHQKYQWGTWKEITAFMSKSWEEGYSITYMQYAESSYLAVASKGTWGHQQWKWGTWKEVEPFIKDKWSKGYSITTLYYVAKGYMVIMTKNTGFGSQQYKWIKGTSGWEQLLDFAKTSWAGGYAITEVMYDGYCTMVMTQNSGIGQQTYGWGSWSDIAGYITKVGAQGYLITDILYGDGMYAIVFSTGGGGFNSGGNNNGGNNGGNTGGNNGGTTTGGGKAQVEITKFSCKGVEGGVDVYFSIRARNCKGRKLNCEAKMPNSLGNGFKQTSVTPNSNDQTFDRKVTVSVIPKYIKSGTKYSAYLKVFEGAKIFDDRNGNVSWTISKGLGVVTEYKVRVTRWNTDVNNLRVTLKGRKGEKVKVVFKAQGYPAVTQYHPVNANSKLYVSSVRIKGAKNAASVVTTVYGADGSVLAVAKWPK